MSKFAKLVFSTVTTVVLALASVPPLTRAQKPDKPAESTWDTTQARGKTRDIDFTTSEGTWMSVDVSPDGRWLVFDLLAQIYRLPVEGGEAQCLTQDSGVALNFHPRISPDGKSIAFISDRKGQNNLWIMDADGKNPRPVFVDNAVRVYEPAWTPDGQYIIVQRQGMGPSMFANRSGLWMYHRNGGEGVELVDKTVRGAEWPSVSPDGKYIYYDYAVGTDAYPDAVKGYNQLRRLELRSGQTRDITAGVAEQQYRGSSGGAIAPEVSPDGKWLTFARRIPNGTISYKGHKFGPRSALWLRNLETGAERVVMDPIEVDMSETFKFWRVLPGYSWSRDGRSVFITQGGKLRRLDVQSGKVDTIPFTARVHRTISEQAYPQRKVSDGPFDVQFTRWQTASPDGSKLAFQAVGRIWIMDLPSGTPHRLTPDSFAPFEYSPSWSPDGRSIAFTSWDEKDGGFLWKIAAGGGVPEKLTRDPAQYLHPSWSPDGASIVVARGSGANTSGFTWGHNLWFDLVIVPAGGGESQFVIRANPPFHESIILAFRRQIVQPVFGPEGRIFYAEQTSEKVNTETEYVTNLTSVRPDGSDKRVHMKFPFADEAAPSPDGKWVAFDEGDNIYLVPLPLTGTGPSAVQIDRKKGIVPVRQLSQEGGLFPHWRGPNTVEFGSANHYYAYHVDSEKTDNVEVHLSVPRSLPQGTVALTGARIITLENRKVIDRGTVIVKGSRITCVGDCDAKGADRVVDLKGKTIIPGFIDMHAHHHRENQGIFASHDYESASYLAYGVTTTMDISMWSQNVFPEAELIEAGMIVGPRTFSTGDPLYQGDGFRWNDLTSYEVTDQNIARLQSWGAITLKQYLQPRRDQRQWVVDVARKRGMIVTGEGDSLEYNLGTTMDGQTGFEHPFSYVPLYSDVARFFGMAHVVYSPTLIVGGAGPWNEEYFFGESDTWKDPKAQSFLPWEWILPHTRRRMLRPDTDYSYPLLAQGLADIIANGGYGSIGAHGQQHGIGSQWEVWMAASALGPMGALEVASLHGAHFLGMEHELGSISSGKLADLVVLNSNPLDNIRNTADIKYVMKGGVLYDGNSLDELWPRQKPFGDHAWVYKDALVDDDRPTDYWDKAKR
jgi:Tol biopolymer transport system component